MILQWLQHPFVETLGWTLLHSLWQLAVVAAITWFVLNILRHNSAQLRYLFCSTSLLIMLALPIISFIYLLPDPTYPSAISTLANADRGATVVVAAHLNGSPIITFTPPFGARLIGTVAPALPYIVLVYLAGALAISLRLLAGCVHLRRLRSAVLPISGDINTTLIRLARKMAISRSIQLFESSLVQVPTVLGELRPIILLPASVIAGVSMAQLEAILTHELAHIRRHDYLANLIQSIIETLLFYHPAVWWLSTQIRQEREHCCDDAVIRAGGSRATYAAALATMESLRTSFPLLTLGANSGALLPRIRRILNRTKPSVAPPRCSTIISGLAPLGILAAMCFLFGSNHMASLAAAPATTQSVAATQNKTQVQVEAKLVMVDEIQATEILRTFPSLKEGNRDTAPGSTLTNEQLISLMKSIQSNKNSVQLAAPRLTFFDGQRGEISIGQEIAYISGIDESVKDAKQLPPKVKTSKFFTGIKLPVETKVSQDRKTIKTTIWLEISQLVKMDGAAIPDAPAELKDFRIQIPVLDTLKLFTTIEIPDNRTALLGGLVFISKPIDPFSDQTFPAGKHYLFVMIHPKIVAPGEIEAPVQK